MSYWEAAFIVKDNKWKYIYDHFSDTGSGLIEHITFSDFNNDGRYDLMQGDVILMSADDGFERWPTFEYSPCGC